MRDCKMSTSDCNLASCSFAINVALHKSRVVRQYVVWDAIFKTRLIFFVQWQHSSQFIMAVWTILVKLVSVVLLGT